MPKAKGKIVTIRLKPDTHKSAKELLAGGGSFQAILENWIEAWVAGSREAVFTKKEEHSFPPADPWHIKLDLVLEEGSDRDRIGIQQNLDWAIDSINNRKHRSQPRAAARRVAGK